MTYKDENMAVLLEEILQMFTTEKEAGVAESR